MSGFGKWIKFMKKLTEAEKKSLWWTWDCASVNGLRSPSWGESVLIAEQRSCSDDSCLPRADRLSITQPVWLMPNLRWPSVAKMGFSLHMAAATCFRTDQHFRLAIVFLRVERMDLMTRAEGEAQRNRTILWSSSFVISLIYSFIEHVGVTAGPCALWAKPPQPRASVCRTVPCVCGVAWPRTAAGGVGASIAAAGWRAGRREAGSCPGRRGGGGAGTGAEGGIGESL